MTTFSIKEVCALLKVTPKTVRRWIAAGKLQNTFKVGASGRVVIPEEELTKFLRPRYQWEQERKEEQEKQKTENIPM